MTAVVGRDRELAEIASFLASTDDAPRALLIEGEAGIGKTTLWRAGVDEAVDRGYRVLACAGAESETQLSFTALRDLLDPVFDETAAELPAPQRRALAVTLLREEPPTRPLDPGAIGVAFSGVLHRLAARGRLLVAVDDVQWVDPASAAVLGYALRRLRDASFRALLARRPEHTDVLALDRIEYDRLQIVELRALTSGALSRILHDQLGIAYPRPTLRRLADTSGGNPFYALELAHALGERGKSLAPGAPLPVPRTLRDLVIRRLETLPVQTLEALTYAAALSRPVLATIEAAARVEVMPWLEPAIDAHLVDLKGDDIGFEHPLFAAGVYALAGPTRRRHVHGRLATVVEDVEERARHLALAADAPSEDVAAELEAAARTTRGRGDRVVSAQLFHDAARLTPEAQVADRARRELAAAAALFDAGDASRAITTIERLVAEADEGAERAEAQLLLGKILADVGRWRDAMRRWAEALDATDDPAHVADIRSCMAVLSIYAGSAMEALVHAGEALAAAERCTGDTGRLAYAYAARAMAGVAAGDSSYAAFLERALELEPVGETPSSAWDWSPTNAASACALHAFDVDEIRARFAALLGRGVESGNADLEQYGAYGLAQAELATGNAARARELSEIVEQLATETGVLHLPGGRLRGEIDAHEGRVTEARQRLAAVIAESRAAGLRRYTWQALAALGALDLAEGRANDAAEELRTARALAEEIGMRDPAILASFVDEAEAAAEANLLDQADEALAAARGLTSQPAWGPPLVLRASGVVSARRGDLPTAEASITRALAEPVSLPVQYGRTLLALGAVQRQLRRRAAARETLQAALETFESVGAQLWAERVRHEVARIGGRGPSGDELTPSEQRIAALVAEGKTNNEVAAALVVSPRTVESALTQIYRKLDVRSRTELARKLDERSEA